MQIPSRRECYRMMAAMEMLPHIAAHSIQVSRVALWLCDRLNHACAALDRELVCAAALLHDITKTRSFATGESHAATGETYLAAKGFSEVGRIVAQHVVLDAFDPESPPNETELINYADKRVLHDQIVPLAPRMAYILERYGTSPEHRVRIRSLWQEAERLEAKLFEGFDLGPDEIGIRLGPDGLTAGMEDFASCGGCTTG